MSAPSPGSFKRPATSGSFFGQVYLPGAIYTPPILPPPYLHIPSTATTGLYTPPILPPPHPLDRCTGTPEVHGSNPRRGKTSWIRRDTLGVYNAQSGSLFHYDSLGTQASTHDKQVYRAAILTLRPIGEPQFTCKKVISRILQSYNQQGDPALSGLYTTLLAELILLRGCDRTYLKRLGDQRHETSERELHIHRFIGHLMYLANRVFPLYTAPPKSQKRAPVSQVQHAGGVTNGSNRRIFIFDTNGRPQIVEELSELLHPITRACYRAHPNNGCFAIGNNHKVTTFTPGGFTKECPHCNAWLTDFEFNRRNALKCKFCFDGRNAVEELRYILQQYQNTPEYMAHLQDPVHPQYRHFR